MTTYATLCYLIRGDETLLLRKAEGLWGGGKWNAPGGKLLPGEPPHRGAVREVREETGLLVREEALELRGRLEFFFGPGPGPGPGGGDGSGGEREPDWVVYVFRAGSFAGEPRAGREGELRWHPLGALPYDEMWADDRYWVPLLLRGRRFQARFRFDEKAERLLWHRVEVLP